MQEQVNKVNSDVENTGIGSDFPLENSTSTPSTSSTPSTISSSTPSTISSSTTSTTSTPSTPTEWDLEIKPQAHLLDINLKEVWKYRDLLWMFVKRDFTAQYKQTILGPLWHFIQPLFTTVVFLVVFTNIAKISTDGVPPVLFYMSGITIWNYFSSCLNATSSTFVANAGIFGKVYFPRLVIPLSTVMSNIVKFGIQFLLLLAAMLWYKLSSTSLNLSQPLS